MRMDDDMGYGFTRISHKQASSLETSIGLDLLFSIVIGAIESPVISVALYMSA